MQKFDDTIRNFTSISLDEINSSAGLLNRFDVKFVFSKNKLSDILSQLSEQYFMLEINEVRKSGYYTSYYDTIDNYFYKSHHNRKKDRYKIRVRQYIDTNDCFLEIKHKINKGKTLKRRIRHIAGDSFSNDTIKFIEDILPVSYENLQFKMNTKFSRITLKNKSKAERLTIDFDLSFSNDKQRIELPEVVIAEVKKEGYSNNYIFFHIAKNNKILQNNFSKYCVGSVLLNKSLKYNNFKPLLLTINKISDVNIISL